MRMIQQAAPMPAIKAGCLTTSEICWDRGFSGASVSVIRPDASEDVEFGKECKTNERRIKIFFFKTVGVKDFSQYKLNEGS